METNVQQNGQSANIPAGIFLGTEIFAQGGEIYAIRNGVRQLFESLPGAEKRSFLSMYMADKDGQQFIRTRFGIVGFESGFKKWLFCKFGSLDGKPDEISGQITPDRYNSACTLVACPGRGKFCGQESGLKDFEVTTLRELKAGKTVKEVADNVHVSEAAVKSRVERLKERFNVTNAVALIATVTELGI